MIKNLELANFKCFENIKLVFKNLNVLTGINSNGKSTIIQSLLLIKQSYEEDNRLRGLYLNGKYVNIGIGQDVLYNLSAEEKLGIKIENDLGRVLDLKIEYSDKLDFQKIVSDITAEGNYILQEMFNDNFSYLSAERLGPQKYYNASYNEAIVKKQIGIHGEFFASFLDKQELSFLTKINEWTKRLGFNLVVNAMENPDAEIVTVKYGNFKPINVGFGISYVLPILVVLLKAKKGDLVIIENPEAHMHPKGQRVLGELIAEVANSGAQIIVETHSDHLLNGIRLAVKKGVISGDNVALNYFYSEPDNTPQERHKVANPEINSDGSITEWPDGFFDEWEKALEEIIV